MEDWSLGAETHYSITPLLQPHEFTSPRFNCGIRDIRPADRTGYSGLYANQDRIGIKG
jgi:hypothetical protein